MSTHCLFLAWLVIFAIEDLPAPGYFTYVWAGGIPVVIEVPVFAANYGILLIILLSPY